MDIIKFCHQKVITISPCHVSKAFRISSSTHLQIEIHITHHVKLWFIYMYAQLIANHIPVISATTDNRFASKQQHWIWVSNNWWRRKNTHVVLSHFLSWFDLTIDEYYDKLEWRHTIVSYLHDLSGLILEEFYKVRKLYTRLKVWLACNRFIGGTGRPLQAGSSTIEAFLVVPTCMLEAQLPILSAPWENEPIIIIYLFHRITLGVQCKRKAGKIRSLVVMYTWQRMPNFSVW